MKRRHLLLAAGLSVLFACSSSDKAGANLSGSLSFSYSGGTSGSFSASGAVNQSSSNLGSNSWAAGTKATSEIEIASVMVVTGGRYHLFTLTADRVTAGTSTISSSGNSDISVEFGASDSDSNFTFVCTLTSGTINFTSVSNSRAAGTFSGAGTCFTSVGGSSAFTVTGGTFDVALLSSVP